MRLLPAGLMFGMAMAGPAAWGLALLTKNTPSATQDLWPIGLHHLRGHPLCGGIRGKVFAVLRAAEVDPIQAVRDRLWQGSRQVNAR